MRLLPIGRRQRMMGVQAALFMVAAERMEGRAACAGNEANASC